MLLDELPVGSLGILADTEDFIALFLEAGIVFGKVAGLCGTTRSTVLRIEIQHQFLSGKITELHLVAIFIKPHERRSGSSFFKHMP